VSWSADPGKQNASVSVNISASQFSHPDFVKLVMRALESTGACPTRLKLELTESMLVKNPEDTIAKMTQLRTSGVAFSLDDFGTGYSSLSYLKRLPLHQIKIDQSFVKDVLTDIKDAAIVRTILALGQTLEIEVIAEGVESREQRDFLAHLGCHLYQGYFFSEPLPADHL
jgi:EAL domain-containing protein (putative c-di-GMP-specific phosphodiesterase class I)